MHASDIDFMIKLLKQRSGLTLTPEKAYLLESRLLPVARANGFNTIDEMVAKIRTQPVEKLMVEITEAMTTNESSFFRDGKPFEQLRQAVLPKVRTLAGARRNIRIWSAAASTGQEPYTIAFTLLEEQAANPGWQYEIIASDLAEKVIERAKQGVYSQFEVQRGLPIQLLVKYFDSLPDTNWKVKDNIRAMVKFQTLNLLNDYGALGKFDIIFCRNVLIYFDEPTKGSIIERLCNSLQPGGILYLGSTESILEQNKRLVQLEGLRGIYQLQ